MQIFHPHRVFDWIGYEDGGLHTKNTRVKTTYYLDETQKNTLKMLDLLWFAMLVIVDVAFGVGEMQGSRYQIDHFEWLMEVAQLVMSFLGRKRAWCSMPRGVPPSPKETFSNTCFNDFLPVGQKSFYQIDDHTNRSSNVRCWTWGSQGNFLNFPTRTSIELPFGGPDVLIDAAMKHPCWSWLDFYQCTRWKRFQQIPMILL